MRKLIITVAVLFAIQLVAPHASADGYGRAVTILKKSRNFRSRVQAAFLLGSETSDTRSLKRRRRALLRALRDRHPAVRAAATSSLGRIGTESYIKRIERLRRDRHPSVGRQARKALLALHAKKPSVNKAKVLAQPANTARSRVGEVMANVTRDKAVTTRLLRKLLNDELASRSDLATTQNLRIDARLLSASFSEVNGQLVLRTELSLMLMNDARNNMVGASRTRTKIVGRIGTASRGEMLRQSLRELVKTAMRDLSGTKLALL